MANPSTQTLEFEDYYFNVGPYSNLFRGRLLGPPMPDGTRDLVAVVRKGVRTLATATVNARIRSFLDESATIQSTLRHPNIARLLERCGPTGVPSIVMYNYHHGNIKEYLSKYSVDRLALIQQVISALQYLHHNGVSHGNLCGENILIADDGTARLSDIGIQAGLKAIFDNNVISSTYCLKAPEELEPHVPRDCRPTPCKDVYALGSLIYEVLIGSIPFSRSRFAYQGVLRIVTQGHLSLPQPPFVDAQLWYIIQRCWVTDPRARATIDEVEALFTAFYDLN